MSFKFNFSVGSEEECSKDVEKTADSTDTRTEESKPFAKVQPELEKSLDTYTPEAFLAGDCDIYYVSEKKVEADLEEQSDEITSVLSKNSDLAPNVYEGGLKIWECSLDLVEYFAEEDIDFEGKQVLELGCGAALPSLYALKNGAEAVHFSDYNDAVLRNVTIPNAHLNCEEDTACSLEKCRFYAGDWAYLQKELTTRGKKYDIIITSETIYSIASYDKLHNAMAALLDEAGVIYLAAKSFYFGVGGGLQSFQELVKERNTLQAEVCKRFDEGVPREILLLRKKKPVG